MIDNLSLGLTHCLLLLVAWRLLWRADLDRDVDSAANGGNPAAGEKTSGWRRRR